MEKSTKPLHERTAFGEHKDGSYYLRASNAEDAGAIQEAAKGEGISLSHRKAPASHEGEKGVYSHFHFDDPAHGASILENLKRLHKGSDEDEDGEQGEGDDGQAGESPEQHIHVHIHGNEREVAKAFDAPPYHMDWIEALHPTRSIAKAHHDASKRTVSGKVVQVKAYDDSRAYVQRKAHIQALTNGLTGTRQVSDMPKSAKANLASYAAMNKTDRADAQHSHNLAATAHTAASSSHKEAGDDVRDTMPAYAKHHDTQAGLHDEAAAWHTSASSHFEEEGKPKAPVTPQVEPMKETGGLPEGHRPIIAGKVETKSGRSITAPPAVTGSHQALKKQREWLKAQAIEEATATKNDYVLGMVQHLDTKNWSQSDSDTTNQFLFGEPDPQFYLIPKGSTGEAQAASFAAHNFEAEAGGSNNLDEEGHRKAQGLHKAALYAHYEAGKTASEGMKAQHNIAAVEHKKQLQWHQQQAWNKHIPEGDSAKPAAGDTSEEREKAYFEKNPPPKAAPINKDNWQPANGRTETPFKARSGATLQYMHNEAKPGEHAYYHVGEDRILTNDEADEHMRPSVKQEAPAAEEKSTLHDKALAAAHAATGRDAKEMLNYSATAHSASEEAEKTKKPTDHYIASSLHMAASMSHDQAREDSDYADNGHEEAWQAHREANVYHGKKGAGAKVSPRDMNAAADRHRANSQQTTIHDAIGATDKKNGGTLETYEKASSEAARHHKGLELGGGAVPTAENHFAAHEAHTAAAHAARAHAEALGAGRDHYGSTTPDYHAAAARHDKDGAWHKFLGDSKMKARDKGAKKKPRALAKSLDHYLANSDLLDVTQRWHVARLDNVNRGLKPLDLPGFAGVQQAIQAAAHAGLDVDQVLGTIDLATGGNSLYAAAVLGWLNG